MSKFGSITNPVSASVTFDNFYGEEGWLLREIVLDSNPRSGQYTCEEHVPVNGTILTTNERLGCDRIHESSTPSQGEGHYSCSVSVTWVKAAKDQLLCENKSGKGHGRCLQFDSACRVLLLDDVPT